MIWSLYFLKLNQLNTFAVGYNASGFHYVNFSMNYQYFIKLNSFLHNIKYLKVWKMTSSSQRPRKKHSKVRKLKGKDGIKEQIMDSHYSIFTMCNDVNIFFKIFSSTLEFFPDDIFDGTFFECTFFFHLKRFEMFPSRRILIDRVTRYSCFEFSIVQYNEYACPKWESIDIISTRWNHMWNDDKLFWLLVYQPVKY